MSASAEAPAGVPIAPVARDAGSPSLACFNRTFKSVYGLPPARYRAGGQHSAFIAPRTEGAGPGFEVAVRELPALPLLGVEHRGSFMQIGRAFDLLYARIASAGIGRPGMRMLALYFDDPAVTPEAELRSMAVVAGCARATDTLGLAELEVPAGPHAVLDYIGPYASMRAAYDWLFGGWLPRSGREPAGGPFVEEYFNNPRDTPPGELRTEIWLPLVPVPLKPS